MISKVLIDYVCDGDLHSVQKDIKYGTSLRDVVTVGQMLENPQE